MADGTLILFGLKKGKQLIKNIFPAVIDLGAHGLAVGTDHGIAQGITGIGPDLVIDGFGLLPVPAVHLELDPPDGRTDQGIGTDRGLVPQEYRDPLGLQFSLDDHGIRRKLKTPQGVKFRFHLWIHCLNSPKIREISSSPLWACRQKRRRSFPWGTVGDRMGRTSKPASLSFAANSRALSLPGTKAD